MGETLRHDVAKCRRRVGGKLCDMMSQSAGGVLGETLRHDVAKCRKRVERKLYDTMSQSNRNVMGGGR